jgi:hypothetical protein
MFALQIFMAHIPQCVPQQELASLVPSAARELPRISRPLISKRWAAPAACFQSIPSGRWNAFFITRQTDFACALRPILDRECMRPWPLFS